MKVVQNTQFICTCLFLAQKDKYCVMTPFWLGRAETGKAHSQPKPQCLRFLLAYIYFLLLFSCKKM